ncbi:hypothetical protein F66182_6476 [Fusarium sp. NRRL 66182]|nr:hypothetical protein F66182_6476 [Fusarium sp. NRRL 66182]
MKSDQSSDHHIINRLIDLIASQQRTPSQQIKKQINNHNNPPPPQPVVSPALGLLLNQHYTSTNMRIDQLFSQQQAFNETTCNVLKNIVSRQPITTPQLDELVRMVHQLDQRIIQQQQTLEQLVSRCSTGAQFQATAPSQQIVTHDPKEKCFVIGPDDNDSNTEDGEL